MIFISPDSSSTMELVDNENKYWIHKVENTKLLNLIDKNKMLGSKFLSSNEFKYEKITKKDEILLFTRFNNNVIFYGYTKVEESFKNNDKLYEHYSNKTKLKIKRIKYFLEPIFIDDFYEYVGFVKNKDNYRRYFVEEYKQISKDDFNEILKQSSSSGMFPVYFEDYSKNMKDFILNTCRSLYNILKNQGNYNQIEINVFISLLKSSLEGYGINKDYNDLKRFYSRYAHELNFKHLPSRDSKKFVKLLTRSGEIRNFAYVSLE